MAADYAIPLKRAWEHHSCPHAMCAAYDDDFKGQYCEGHAALLEMVDGHHLAPCVCGHKGDLGEAVEDMSCVYERRRLRAAVGVKEESDDAESTA